MSYAHFDYSNYSLFTGKISFDYSVIGGITLYIVIITFIMLHIILCVTSS